MTKVFAAVFLMALVTYLPRVLPISIFKKKIKSPFVRFFLYYIPYAVLGAMTFPSILFSTGNLYASLAGTGVALFLAYREKGLMTVAVSAVLTVYLFGLLFL